MNPNVPVQLVRRCAAVLCVCLLVAGGRTAATAEPAAPPWLPAIQRELLDTLGPGLDQGARARLERGVRQVASLWRSQDGDAAAFRALVRTHLATNQATLDAMFARLERAFEKLDGHFSEMSLALRWHTELDLGPILPFDDLLAGYAPAAHVGDDLFANGLAFVVLLNFPLTTLQERLEAGMHWTRRQWAEARLAQRFDKRIPAPVQSAVARATAAADRYVAEYNIWMHHLVDDRGERHFPPKLRLLSHWNLRDEIKAQYAAGPQAVARQRMIQRVMERIVDQSIPAAVINTPRVDWNPVSNRVQPAGVRDDDLGLSATATLASNASAGSAAAAPVSISNAPEPDTRYARLLDCFRAVRQIDPHSPTAPTHIARRFDEERQIPEARVRAMLEAVVGSPLAARVAGRIEARLGRPLEPFDIWYPGFLPRGAHDEAELDALVARRYPTAAAYQADIPRLLEQLGFAPERARFLAARIAVDPARGSGHAAGPAMRDTAARLRTRVGAAGMDYKGFNIALHEMGHNVEQVISMNLVDHTLLQGVPNTAFTEAVAFVFQAQDLRLLGLDQPGPRDAALKTLNDFWITYEIAGVGLVDMAVWHWMYGHPDATPAELKGAMLDLARQVWNRFYAPVFKRADVTLLAIYSHLVNNLLYLPDYAVGHLISHQIDARIHRADGIGPEIERMTRLGNIAPDLWMREATGAPVGPEALLEATAKALESLP
jgi:hypothetical protein